MFTGFKGEKVEFQVHRNLAVYGLTYSKNYTRKRFFITNQLLKINRKIRNRS